MDAEFCDYEELLHTYEDRKSTRLNSSHVKISYAVFCLKKKKYRQGTGLEGAQESRAAAAVVDGACVVGLFLPPSLVHFHPASSTAMVSAADRHQHGPTP